MLTREEQVSTSEIWADLQYHKVLNYLTGRRIFTHGTVRLVWLGAPWLALYSALEYEQGGGPLWILHTEDITGHLHDSRKENSRSMISKFAKKWLEYSKQDNLEGLPISTNETEGYEQLKKWTTILESMSSDPLLWPS
jgi:hypothetical protein